jgi:hypothetical protein
LVWPGWPFEGVTLEETDNRFKILFRFYFGVYLTYVIILSYFNALAIHRFGFVVQSIDTFR